MQPEKPADAHRNKLDEIEKVQKVFYFMCKFLISLTAYSVVF
jgi:hypothetical protein